MSTTNTDQSTRSASSPSDQQRQDAAAYMQQLRAFYLHGAVFVISMVGIFVVNLATNISAGITGEWWAWWSAWALLGWGLGVAVHGLVVRMARPQGPESVWEERQINKLLASESAEMSS